MTDPRAISRLSFPTSAPPIGRANNPITGPPRGRLGPAAGSSPPESLLTVAWRNRWIILICTVLAVAAGFIYLQVAVPVYTSNSKLYLEYVNIVPPASEPGRIPQTERYLQTQAGLLGSRPIVAAATQKLERQRLQTFRDVDIPAAFVATNIRIEVGKRDDIISVEFDSPHPIEAAQIVNEVVEAYMASRSRQEQRNATQVLAILQKDMTRVKQELEKKERELENFQTKDMPLALGSEMGGMVMQSHLGGLQTELTTAQTAAMKAKSFRDAVRILSEDARALQQYLQVRESVNRYLGPVAERSPLEVRVLELDLQIEELSDKLTPDHPTVAMLVKQRATIQARLSELDSEFTETVVAAAEQRYSEAVDHERQLVVLCEEQRGQATALNAELVRYQRLRAGVERLRESAQTLEQQVGEIARIVNEDVGQLRMAILEPAVPAEDPSSPQKAKVMAVALMFGFLLGGGIAVARDWLDQTLRSTDEISARLGLPVLGVVPAMSRRLTTQERGCKVLLQPNSHESEAYRTLRTAVFFSASKGQGKTILITSPGPGEGKSTVTSNLGIAMAQTGQRTLILDADFRRPMQHSVFELDHRELSLSSVFAGKTKLAAAIQPTRLKGLDILTCGYGIPNPAEVLGSQRFARLVKTLGSAYDRVLIDTPPVTVVTDAQIIGALCDATILVLKVDRSTRKAAERAIELLRSVGAEVLGIVANGASKSDDYYGYHGHYCSDGGTPSGNGQKDKRQHAGVGARGKARRNTKEISGPL